MTIAVTGSTGQLGPLVIEELKSRTDEEIIALARSPEKGSSLGVTVREFDYDRPETLGPALEGVETLILISGSEVGQRERQHKAVIAAAEAAGVTRILYTSLLRADTSPLALAPEHVATEAALAESSLNVTILRNGWYFENYAGSVASALEHGALVGAAGDAKINAATRADYAAAAAGAATSPDTVGKTYELAGDTGFTMSELAAALTAKTGRDIPYSDMPVAEYQKVLEGAGLPAETAGFVAGLDAGTAEGALASYSKDLSTLAGRPTTSLSDWVATVA
ncbi:SDR family oxidoreductase [Pelagovum pacificum]|uniref:SDR family oxidoreductase n=1 Tax=Pelagovum pacificum TaxID=2588711 RepID=A0A5C5GBT9_9RHOB|nr:SDR family oxidoreductase [Pelagovum pacificum]QQA44638.1 SDR family oxidoreductase [Pelagovum pacificum]TNY32252.1 SDR family oxidoreductase [Pelagovum pacificum]